MLPIITIEDVIKNVRVNLTSKREALIRDAYAFAEVAHRGQKRDSGEDYMQHPLHTALNLAKLGVGSKTIAAGLLHDVPEDTDSTLKQVEEKFGAEIAFLVDGITKLGKIKLRGNKEEMYLENLRKMFLAMASDIRVVLVKLADRLHNMETLRYKPEEKRHRIALETLEVYAPIANRLGIGEIKGRLEDLSFEYLDPENYDMVKKLEEKELSARKKNLDKAVTDIKKELLRESIKVISVYGRAKRLYRLFKKLEKHDMNLEKIYDLIGVRVIVPEIADCYETLGIVHKKYRPLVGRIKDYVSLPKPNGYQSIHTTVFGPEGRIMEIQIRTQQMHDEAEYGIAAHWIYSEQKNDWRSFLPFGKKEINPTEDVAWIRQLQDWQSATARDNEEFLEGLKIEFFKNHIFAFTPTGDVIDLPEEATPIDFAYKVHSEIGNRAIGAKADGKMVPLSYKIRNGEVIEIMTSKEHKSPNQDWLRFARTSLAKSQVKKFLKKDGLL